MLQRNSKFIISSKTCFVYIRPDFIHNFSSQNKDKLICLTREDKQFSGDLFKKAILPQNPSCLRKNWNMLLNITNNILYCENDKTFPLREVCRLDIDTSEKPCQLKNGEFTEIK